ncbi:MAG: hypothetical protein FJX70_07195 [Alphaproteobacteria bacterium]|nr:hypothetical protein [Alphaproteobacteria bacterium]
MNIIEEVEIEFSRAEARRFNKWENDRLKNLSQVDFGKIYGELYVISIENKETKEKTKCL